MSVRICDYCGNVAVDNAPCRCDTPHDLVQIRRRHHDAVALARRTGFGQADRTKPTRAA